jgi:hypothetical protein
MEPFSVAEDAVACGEIEEARACVVDYLGIIDVNCKA